MRTKLLISLIIILISCSKRSDSPNNQTRELQVKLSLAGISTRSIDGTIYDEHGKGYTLPFSAVKQLRVVLYESLSSDPIFTHQATIEEIKEIQKVATGAEAQLNIPNIPQRTKYAKVFINEFTDVNPNINHLQVSNQDTPAAPTMNRDQIPYEGTSTEIVLPSVIPSGAITMEAKVEVAPMLSRVEIKPGTIKITNPVAEGYVFDWTEGAAGKALIKEFSAAQITAAENSALLNFRKKHGQEPSAAAIYSYRVRTVRQTINSDINNTALYTTDFYINYFKQLSTSTNLVKNGNNSTNGWKSATDGGTAGYIQNGAHSNMYNTVATPLPSNNVVAYHLFPQSVDPLATKDQVKDGMPHIILCFKDKIGGDPRWLTIRAFSDLTDSKIITSFKSGYCYSLALNDITLTPWSIALEVRLTDNAQSADSDPIIKNLDQTSNVPEPENTDLSIRLTVRAWSEDEIVVEV